jgi:phosphoribosyl-ATP pyrophosphohydrolase/phosphoribosyl-AMP cyclohydrolase
MSSTDLAFLAELESIVRDRLQNPVDGSYTARLAAEGNKRIAQKVGEEGVELSLAAVAGDDDEVIDEAADLVYHLIVLLADRDIGLADVVARLRARHDG